LISFLKIKLTLEFELGLFISIISIPESILDDLLLERVPFVEYFIKNLLRLFYTAAVLSFVEFPFKFFYDGM
jgi:hypothetical protein